MTESLTLDDFSARLGETFQVRPDDGETTDDRHVLKLVEAAPVEATTGQRQQFSLVFEGVTESIPIQRIYHLSHPDFEELMLFLVPIFRDLEGMRCEAVFT